MIIIFFKYDANLKDKIVNTGKNNMYIFDEGIPISCILIYDFNNESHNYIGKIGKYDYNAALYYFITSIDVYDNTNKDGCINRNIKVFYI